MNKNIGLIASGFNTTPLAVALLRQPWLWNQNPGRTESPASPHHGLDDIWVRYNDPDNLKDAGPKAYAQEHDSVWWPAYAALPQVRPLVFRLMNLVEGERLGAVLITRIPPGAQCKPHADGGWHAEYYDKYAIQIQSDHAQAFHFEGESLSARPGDVYWFNNLNTHWVTNDTEHERITMIVCIRSNRVR